MTITASPSEKDEIARAEAQVAKEKAELTRSLRAVGRSSEKMAQRLGNELKPVAGAAVVVAGAAIAVGVTVALVRRSRRRSRWLAPEPPSAITVAAKTVGLWALRYLARRAAQDVLSRLSAHGVTTDADSPAALRS